MESARNRNNLRGIFALPLIAILLSSAVTLPSAFSNHADPFTVELTGASTIGNVSVVINLEGTSEVTPDGEVEDEDDDEGSVHLRITGGNVTIGSDTFNITSGRAELKNSTSLELEKLNARIQDGDFHGKLKLDMATVNDDGTWTDVQGRLKIKEKGEGTKNEIMLTFTASGTSAGVLH